MNNRRLDTQLLMEGWRRFLTEGDSGPDLDPAEADNQVTAGTGENPDIRKAYTYCSVILDKDSQDKLTELISGIPEIAQLKGATPAQKMCHHMTIQMGTSLKPNLAENFKHGQKTSLVVREVVASIENEDGISAAKISNISIPGVNMPHVTLTLNNRKPFEAGKIGNELKQTFSENVGEVTLVGYVNIPSQVP